MRVRGRRGLQSLATALLLLGAAGAGWADASGLLRAADTADQRLSYTGIRTIRAGRREGGPELRVKVWHQAPDRTRIEYLSPGSGNLLLENGGGRWFYSARMDRWRPVEYRPIQSRLELLLRNYRVRRQGTAAVAGRNTVLLSIEPRHPGNPTKKVWIEPTLKMALREEVRDSEGRLIAASSFEQFGVVREHAASLFEPPIAAVARTTSAPPPFPPLLPRYVPPGYQEIRQIGLRRGSSRGVQLRYTDGLGTISLFQFRQGRRRANDQSRRRWKNGRSQGDRDRLGDRNRYRRRIGELECTVMGDVAGEELRRMLESLPAPPAERRVEEQR